MATSLAAQALLVEQLLGGSLSAVVKAQAMAANQLVALVEQIGFEGEGDERAVRSFPFSFTRKEFDPQAGEIVTQQVHASVPLLSILNLPAIAIDEATVDMDMQLVASTPASTPSAATSPSRAPAETPQPMHLFALPMQPRTSGQQQDATRVGMRVSVKLRRQDALGMDRLQSLLDSAVSEEVQGPE